MISEKNEKQLKQNTFKYLGNIFSVFFFNVF